MLLEQISRNQDGIMTNIYTSRTVSLSARCTVADIGPIVSTPRGHRFSTSIQRCHRWCLHRPVSATTWHDAIAIMSFYTIIEWRYPWPCSIEGFNEYREVTSRPYISSKKKPITSAKLPTKNRMWPENTLSTDRDMLNHICIYSSTLQSLDETLQAEAKPLLLLVFTPRLLSPCHGYMYVD